MIFRSPAPSAMPPAKEFDSLDTGKLTWVGLSVAGIGWVLLIGETTVADVLIARSARPISPTFHADLVDIAKCIIASGFGLAVVGALQTGFGALNRFFEAVLLRSSQRGPAAERPMTGTVEPAAPAPAAAPLKRPYRLLPDGSVEVETIVGTRRFETLAQAREFI